MRAVILGGGQAGVQTAVSLRSGGWSGPIVLVADEHGLPYQRPPLSKAFLTGRSEPLPLRAQAQLDRHAIELRAATRALRVDRAARTVSLEGGGELAYEQLVLALGARPRELAVPGASLSGVLSLRTLDDARRLSAALAAARRVVIVGGGFIGLEVAAAACRSGRPTTVVEVAGRLMSRLVSEPTARRFAEHHRERGLHARLGTGVVALHGDGDGRVSAVETSDGERLPADVVVLGVGVRPNVELAADAGLAVDDGILVDEQLRCLADPDVSAIGDCARFASITAGRSLRLESVQNAADHARCVAARLTGNAAAYDAVPWFWSEQHELKLQIAGDAAGHDRAILVGDRSARFSVLCFRGERLLGVESVNSAHDHMAARRLLASPELTASVTPQLASAGAFDLAAHVARTPHDAAARGGASR